MLDFSNRKLAITNLMMLTVSVLWGVAWPVGRLLATDLLDFPFTVMFLRYSFAVPILFAWMWIKEGNVIPKTDDWKALVIMVLRQKCRNDSSSNESYSRYLTLLS